MIVLHEAGLVGRVDCLRSVVAFAAPPNDDVLRDNPLGKIPTLVLDDGTALFDSRVICEYLDGLHDGVRLFPEERNARIRQLRWLALGDGLTDILLLWRIERLRGASANPVILASFDRKVRASLALLEAEAAQLSSLPFGIGHAAVICALGQLDFRFKGSGWVEAHSQLAEWYDRMKQRPSVRETEVQDDTPATDMSEDTAPALVFEVA